MTKPMKTFMRMKLISRMKETVNKVAVRSLVPGAFDKLFKKRNQSSMVLNTNNVNMPEPKFSKVSWLAGSGDVMVDVA